MISVICLQVHCCFTSTEAIRTIGDGEPRTATSTFTQLLNSASALLPQCLLGHNAHVINMFGCLPALSPQSLLPHNTHLTSMSGSFSATIPVASATQHSRDQHVCVTSCRITTVPSVTQHSRDQHIWVLSCRITTLPFAAQHSRDQQYLGLFLPYYDNGIAPVELLPIACFTKTPAGFCAVL